MGYNDLQGLTVNYFPTNMMLENLRLSKTAMKSYLPTCYRNQSAILESNSNKVINLNQQLLIAFCIILLSAKLLQDYLALKSKPAAAKEHSNNISAFFSNALFFSQTLTPGNNERSRENSWVEVQLLEQLTEENNVSGNPKPNICT